jgi:indoleamine 2,3-dioxygenase
MPERCDPFIYYHRVRPFIHGWKNNPALPNGIVYTGVEEYREAPQYFRGETGAQSSIIPALDAALGITHAEDPLTVYLAAMRHYMPPAHRAFLEALERQQDHQGRPWLAGYIHDHQSRHPEMWSAYCQCVQLLARFRATHLDYAATYIHQQSETQSSNPTSVGTGGTPFMTYLKKHL